MNMYRNRTASRRTGWQIALPISLLPLSVATALPQSYTLESFALGAGGGTSSGGTYSVSGTIGQTEPGTLAGGNFTVDGGFWAVVSEVVVPGPPELTIRSLSDGSVQICWPGSGNFVLQESANLDRPLWSTSLLSPVDMGATRCVTVPRPTANRYYRLVK